MAMTDSIAFVSRKLAQTRWRGISEVLFRYWPDKQGEAVIRNFDGNLTMRLEKGSYISRAIYWGGHHSQGIVRFLRGFLRPNMTLADIGANIGEITLVAAKQLSRGRVLSFEPMSHLFTQLSQNVTLNRFDHVLLFNMGLLDRDDSLPLYVRSDHPFGTINEGVLTLYPDAEGLRHEIVPLRRFDDVAREAGITRLDVMKIDVEGAEWMVLRGAQDSIQRFRPVIILEIDSPNFQRAGYTTADLVSCLNSLNYDVRTLEGGYTDLPYKCDALCLPRESRLPRQA